MKLQVVTAENIFRQITIDLSGFMGYRHKQYDDVTLFVARFLPDGTPGVTLSEIPAKIDVSNITEWNWGIKYIEKQN